MKKIGLIILGSFIFLSSVAFSCPDKNFHDKATAVIKELDKTVYLEGDTLYLKQKELILMMMVTYPKNDEFGITVVKEIYKVLTEYCQNHKLKFEILE